ncbi:MAG: molybdopterin dinucleotide binding domain-containing protein [Pseudomarimonas sp.]
MTRLSRYRSCPLCEAICGLELQYEADTLVAIRGDAADPFSRGHICPKGNAILDLEADPDRLRMPLRRHGTDFEEIGWDEALAEAGGRLAAVQREHGADAVAAYVGNPNVHHFGHLAYLSPLLKTLRTRNIFSASSVDQWPHQLVAYWMFGHQFLLPIPDIDNTHFMLMLGANPVASNGSLMTAPGIEKRLKALVERGTLVVVDPRRSETAAIASEHLFVRPGGDVWLLLAFLQALQRVGSPRLAAYAGRVQGFESALAAIHHIDSSHLFARSGVEPAVVERLAAAFFNSKTAVVYGRMGVSTQAHGTLCQWLIQLINLYAGQLDRVGGCLPNDPVMPVTGPGTSAGGYGRWRSRVRGLPEVSGELPVAVLREEITTPGAGQVRGLFTCAGNPVLSTPHSAALDAALSGLQAMISVDIYVNETTRHAHLILPPASMLSQPHYDTIFNAFAVRRVARYSPPVRPQADHERADWQILQGIAAAHAQASGRPFQPLPPPPELIAQGLARGGEIGLAELVAAPHGLDLGPLRPTLLGRLQTASGAIECAPAVLMDALRGLEASLVATVNANSLQLVGRRHIRSNNSWMHNAPRLIKGKPRHHLLMHPADLAARGLDDGARVRLRSRTGSIDTDVQASDELQPGVVCLPHGFGHAVAGTRQARAQSVDGANYNVLSDPEHLDGVSGNVALNGVEVWVEAAL